jgi:hypothetical protein
MATKKRTTLNKSEEIRRALTQNPDKGPAELARMLTEQHGVPFRRKAISSIKSKMGLKAAPSAKPAAPMAARKTPGPVLKPMTAIAKAEGGVAVMVANLQAYIDRLGKKDLHELIDTL